MKWKNPPIGAYRIVKLFAWFPIECVSGESAWLETVFVKQEYRGSGWHDSYFVSEREYLEFIAKERREAKE